MEVMRAERHVIKRNYKFIDELSFKAKSLYNLGNYIMRQALFISSALKENKSLNSEQQKFLNEINTGIKAYNERGNNIPLVSRDNSFLNLYFLNYYLKETPEFKALPAQTAQSCLKSLNLVWKSFYASIKAWKQDKSKFLGRPKLPKYKHKAKGRYIVSFTNQQCKIKDGYIVFPKVLNGFTVKTRVKSNLQQVRFIPKLGHYVIEVIYKIEVPDKKGDNGRYLGIDIGLDNLAALSSNTDLKPVLIKGKGLKSINQYYNKKLSHLKSICKRVNKVNTTKRIQRLTAKRNAKIEDYMHKASKDIIQYAIENNANTIVIGVNTNWKQEVKLGTVTNQNFVAIPFKSLIDKIKYKAENYGLNVIETEESYTSGTSFLDGELPTKENYRKSRRVKRGLFKSNTGKYINADVNAAFQIIRKAFPDVEFMNRNLYNPEVRTLGC